MGEAPGDARGASDGAFTGPRTRIEAAIAGIWCELLRAERVGVDEDFFELGGDSLMAVRMLGALEDVLLAQVSFADFLEDPTIAALAAFVVAERRRGTSGAEIALEAGPLTGSAPCTFAQERLWFVDQLTEASGAYNESIGARIKGPLDIEALEWSCGELVKRHAALRTSFAVRDGTPVQVLSEDVALTLELIDLSEAADPERALDERAQELASLPFDLSLAPLVRASVLRAAADDHVLQLVFHHAITDGLSHTIVAREFGELYRSRTVGAAPELPAPVLQYPDFARWQRARLQGAALEEAIAPWRDRLAGVPAALDLPTDKPRPPVQSHRGASRRVPLGASITERIHEFSRAHAVTAFTTLLAVFDVLLYRYSGQQTIVVGSAAGGRDRPELEGVVGLFANTIVLRGELSDDMRFGELLTQARHRLLDAVAHQEAPFERLVAELQREPDLSRHPLYQVSFSFRPHARLELPGATPFHSGLNAARADLTLWVEEAVDGFELVWEYSTDLFEVHTIERLERHFMRLLEAALADADTPVGALSMLDAVERLALLEESGPTQSDFPVACMHSLFEERAARQPDAPAVTFEGRTLSYGELNGRANRLAHRLRELGIGPESLVALFLQRSLEMVVAVLAVLKAGGAYVPLDPEYPAGRIEFVLTDTGAPVLLTQSDMVERLPASTAQVLRLDQMDPELASYSAIDPETATTPANLAYVIYTSGSTGQPKGVQVEHRQVARLFSATEHWYGFGPHDTWVLAHSYAFDVSVWELWGALAHGGRIVVSPFWVTRTPEAFAQLVAEERVTVLCATPSLFGSAQDELIIRGEQLSVRCVVFAGEALQPASLRPWFDFFGEDGPALVNMYGITETTVHSTYRVMRASDCMRDASPIGVPIPDLGLYLLDGSGASVPPGVTGEIYVGGAGVTRGYLNRPELTAQRFLENPFGPGRLYRSGDLARRTPDGETMFLGRMDDQIKIRGFRIELGEIRSVLEDHEAVADSAVLAHRLADGDTRLAAYVVPSEQRRSASELRSGLRAHLERRLPSYMVPSSITLLDELPLTTNGKLDRRSLPAPDWEREREVSFASPRTPGEMQVARHWKEVLEVGEVGRGDNFFRMGGHSLLAARLVARMRESLGIELSVRTLFEHPTLSAFAEQVDAATAGASERPLQHTVPERSGALEHPVSFQQEQMLFFDNLSPGNVTYNGALVVRVGGELDYDELREALAEVQRRHEVLRTVLSSDEHSVRQLVREQLDYELALEDLTDTPAAVSESELKAILRKHALVPFDLAREAPLRTKVFRLGPSEHVIMFALHHIAFDARAVEVLYGEISEIYAARRAGRTPVLPELTLQYGDFARWQRERLSGKMLEDELDFWRSSLAGAPTAIELPTDHRRPATQTFDGASLVARYDGELAGRIDAVCQAQGVTPYMLLLAGFATLLYRRSGQDDILISGPMENRSNPSFDHLIGFLANTSVVRLRLGGNPTYSALLGGVRDSVLASYEHQQVPLELIVDAVRPARLPGVNPLVQVNFRVRSGALPSLSLAGAQTNPVPIDLGIARFDLALEVHLIDDGLAAEWIWNTALFARERVERLASDFESLLIQALADPGTPVLALELPNERSPQRQSDGATRTPSIRRVRAVGRGSR